MTATTLARFILSEQRQAPGATGEFSALLADLVIALKTVGLAVSRGAAAGARAEAGAAAGARLDACGDPQKPIDLLANDLIVRGCEWGGHLAAMASEEMERIYPIPEDYPRGKYLLVFDPLDGSSNLDVDITVGTIFSVLRRPDGAGPVTEADFLQPGVRQVCAGYALYGPATLVVLTFGRGVHGFTLDRELGEFVLTHRDLRIPAGTREFAINASNTRFWEPPVQRYVQECLDGRTGPRGEDFNMRWVATFVAEVHRILMRGGLYLYPRDSKEPGREGRLRLLYEANPLALLVEQAGGAASTGRERILEVQPTGLHARVPVLLGCRAEVERLERYHREHAAGLDRPYSSPLFGSRSLFTAP